MKRSYIRLGPDHLAARSVKEHDARRVHDLQRARPFVGVKPEALRCCKHRVSSQREAHYIELRELRLDLRSSETLCVQLVAARAIGGLENDSERLRAGPSPQVVGRPHEERFLVQFFVRRLFHRGPHIVGEGLLSFHATRDVRSEEHTSELQSQSNLVCRLLLEKKKKEKKHKIMLWDVAMY